MHKKVLIAEDDRDISQVMEMFLKQHGYEVFTAFRSDEVIPAVLENSPNLLLLDVMMPGIKDDGFSICRRLKTDYSHIRIPIIIVSAIATGTGYSERDIRIQSGADDFVAKPFENQDLLKRMERLLFING